MIPVQVREEHRRLHRLLREERLTQPSNARACVEDEPMPVADDLEARRVATDARDV